MRPPKVSDEAIIQAGSDLLATGKQVTGSALRKRLGAGKSARLKRVWEAYQAAQTAGAAPPLVLPPGVTQRLEEITRQFRDDLCGVVQDLQRHFLVVQDLPGQDVAESGASEALLLRQEVAALKASLDTALDHIGQLFIHLNSEPANHQPEHVQEDVRRAAAFLKSLVLPDLSARSKLVNASLKRGRGVVSPPPAELP